MKKKCFQILDLTVFLYVLFIIVSCTESEKDETRNTTNNVCKISLESLGDWDEGIIINDSLYFVTKNVPEVVEYAEYIDSTGEGPLLKDTISEKQYAVINVLGSDENRAIFLEYDINGNVTSIRKGDNLYTYEWSKNRDSLDVMCYNLVSKKMTVVSYPISSSNLTRSSFPHLYSMTRGINMNNLGNALTAIQLTGDAIQGNWIELLGDATKALGIGVLETILKKPLWPLFAAYDWWNEPNKMMEAYIFGKSSIKLLTIIKNEDSHTLSGVIENASTIPDVEWEWGNSSVPEKYKKYGKPNIVNYYVDVKTPSGTYRLGPEVANHQSSFSLTLNKMTHGYYYFYSYLTGSGYTRRGTSMSYYHLGESPTYSHSNENLNWNGETGKYDVSFYIAYQHLYYAEIEFQGLYVETEKGTKLGSFGMGRNGGYQDEDSISSSVSKSEFKEMADGSLELTVRVKYWYVLRGSKRTMYVELPSFTIKNGLCPDENHPHAIDLGLPSGTKWACCNVGASSPKEYGGHYAWGETWTKSVYSLETYSYNGINIGSEIAGTNYDVAAKKWKMSWRMPTYYETLELVENTTSKWTGVGMEFKGRNGGSIILPAAGRHYEYVDDVDEGYRGCYWTSTLYLPALYFKRNGKVEFNWYDSYYGLSVRPIWKE